MKILANENFPFSSVLYLRKIGFDIISVGTDYPGYKDIDIINLAIKDGRTILTFDRDYGELIFKFNHQPEKGVIYLRLDDFKPQEPGELIENLLLQPDFNPDNALTVINKNGVRQRKY